MTGHSKVGQDERERRQKGDGEIEWTRIQVVGLSNGIVFLPIEFVSSIPFVTILYYPILFYSIQKCLDFSMKCH